MHLKSIIIGLFLFCIGGGMFWWIVTERKTQAQQAQEYKEKYGSETIEYIKLYEEWMLLPVEERAELPEGLDLNAQKSTEQILQEQKERLIADMDKLAAGAMTVYPFTDEFYGSNWQDKIEEYKKQKEQREFLYSVSIACASSGGLLTGWVILFNFAKVIIKLLSKIKNKLFSGKKEEKTEELNTEGDETEKETEEKLPSTETQEEQKDEHFKDISNVLANSGWQYASSFGNEQKPRLRQRKRIPTKNRIVDENNNSDTTNTTKETVETNSADTIDKTQNTPVENENKTTEDKTESETVVKQDVDITNPKGNNQHIDTTLKDLTQQVSAIREYAANQQNRLERLQDGYDWNIIKTFCLRIIRCIDNIEKRILQLEEEDIQTTHLEEVRDELVFSLESSGIEQFEPKVNSNYRGQEKIAEAVKEKTKCDDPDKKGKIEKVLKPGYQFYIDDENVKIVRPAQVRIYA